MKKIRIRDKHPGSATLRKRPYKIANNVGTDYNVEKVRSGHGVRSRKIIPDPEQTRRLTEIKHEVLP